MAAAAAAAVEAAARGGPGAARGGPGEAEGKERLQGAGVASNNGSGSVCFDSEIHSPNVREVEHKALNRSKLTLYFPVVK